jgi:uncharacterized protein YigE (DUF2233 family)
MKILWCMCGFIALVLFNNAYAMECKRVEIAGKHLSACSVEVGKDALQLLRTDDSGKPFKRFDRLADWLQTRGHSLVFAMNAGMYHSNFNPVGLFIADGKQMASLNTADGEGNFFLKPNGVFALSNGGARIMESSEYAALHETVLLATQSGPLLVRSGYIHPLFKVDSTSRLIRNGVGVTQAGIAVFVISDDLVNFYEFASLFRDYFHCPNALYLDGTVSSLYSSELKRNDDRMDLGPIIALIN